jgi:hypothetical protein
VTISVSDGNARTLAPTGAPAFSRYIFSIKNGAGAETIVDKTTEEMTADESGKLFVQVQLLPDNYSVEVKAYSKCEGVEYCAARGTGMLTVRTDAPGGANSLTITLYPEALDASGDNGFFVWSITLPADSGGAVYTGSLAITGEGGVAVSGSPRSLAAGVNNGRETLPPGEYNVHLSLSKTITISDSNYTFPFGEYEALYIYAGNETF